MTAKPFEVWYTRIWTDGRDVKASAFATLDEANQYANDIEDFISDVRVVGTTDEAKAAIENQKENHHGA